MADICDVSDARTEAESGFALAVIRAQLAVREHEPNGVCHNPRCAGEVDPGKLFCDATCAQEYEQVKKRGQQG